MQDHAVDLPNQKQSMARASVPSGHRMPGSLVIDSGDETWVHLGDISYHFSGLAGVYLHKTSIVITSAKRLAHPPGSTFSTLLVVLMARYHTFSDRFERLRTVRTAHQAAPSRRRRSQCGPGHIWRLFAKITKKNTGAVCAACAFSFPRSSPKT